MSDAHSEPDVTDALERYFKPLAESFFKLYYQKWSAGPPQLHHYTASADAVVGVIENGVIFATDARFLNDRSELDYGHAIVLRALKSYRRRATALLRPFIDRIYLSVEANASFFDVYVACFCGSSDSLAHWQAYARQGEGYDLVFTAGKFAANARAVLARVEYSPRIQARHVRSIVDSAFEMFLRDAKAAPDDENAFKDAFDEWTSAGEFLLLTVVPMFKDPRFRLEGEWRLVYPVPSSTISGDVKFRTSGPRILPYISLNLRDDPDDSATLPLTKIAIMADSEGWPRQRALQQLLRNRGINATVERSALPLRV